MDDLHDDGPNLIDATALPRAPQMDTLVLALHSSPWYDQSTRCENDRPVRLYNGEDTQDAPTALNDADGPPLEIDTASAIPSNQYDPSTFAFSGTREIRWYVARLEGGTHTQASSRGSVILSHTDWYSHPHGWRVAAPRTLARTYEGLPPKE